MTGHEQAHAAMDREREVMRRIQAAWPEYDRRVMQLVLRAAVMRLCVASLAHMAYHDGCTKGKKYADSDN